MKIIKYICISIKDKIKNWKTRKQVIFADYGIKVFTGLFGSGKTSSLVEYAYRKAVKYKGLNILTNISLFNFPPETVITELKSLQQIIDAPNGTIVIIDEISSIFNSRNWANGIPKRLKYTLLQVRKKRMMILGTAQEFVDVDVFIRRVCHTVFECRCMNTRWNFVETYNGQEYERTANPQLLKTYSFIQTDFIRSLYDTNQLISRIESLPEDAEADKTADQLLDELSHYKGKTNGPKKKRGRPPKNKLIAV